MAIAGQRTSIPRPDIEPAQEPPPRTELALGHGRTLAVVESDQVEIRAEGGALEVRIRVTAEGPVLAMEGIRLSLDAADSIELRSRRITLESQDQLTLASRGQAQLLAQDRIEVKSREYLGLDGKIVGLRSDEQTIIRDIAEREFDGDIDACLRWLAEQAPAVDW